MLRYVVDCRYEGGLLVLAHGPILRTVDLSAKEPLIIDTPIQCATLDYPCPALPCPALPCPALPCPALD